MKNFFINAGGWNSSKSGVKGALDLKKFVREFLQNANVPAIDACCSTVSAGTPVRFNSTSNELEQFDGTTWTVKNASKSTIGVISADGAVTIPVGNKTFFITKGSAAAITLANPTATTHDGVTLTFVSTTAYAHTLSNVGGAGFNGDGSGKDLGLFGAAKANLITVSAYQGVWYVISNVGVTFS